MRRSRSVVLFVFLLVQCSYQLRKDPEYWSQLASEEFREALKVRWNEGRAKNVILFIGDGMGPNTVTATRIYKGGESHRLSYEKFPHIGLLKTYSANKMVPDSASTATALLCGVKVNQHTMGVDASVEHRNCSASLNPSAKLESLAALALKAGKSAGFVTTMRVTHATPGPVYAHSAARQWECDSALPPDGKQCKDIARQLIEDFPGRDLHVVMGGGRQSLVTNVSSTPDDPISSWACSRSDGKNLIQEYRKDKEDRKLRYSVVSNNRELNEVDVDNTDYLFGIFANAHLRYESERNKGPNGMPSISEMVDTAIKILKKNENGFFLMVEGGNIDMAHHRGRAKLAIDESAAMEDAVKVAASYSDDETLLIVTSDHTHTLTINGYSERGSNIFGVTGPSPYDGLYYTTLAYGTGGPGSFQYTVKNDTNDRTDRSDRSNFRIVRQNLTTDITDDMKYEQAAAITLDENIHGGGDVIVYAKGPFAHLFHNVHEQHYVYHVITYAAKIGPHSTGNPLKINVAILCITFMFLIIYSRFVNLS